MEIFLTFHIMYKKCYNFCQPKKKWLFIFVSYEENLCLLCISKILHFRAVKKACNNAKHPDLYGHYREAKFTQTKHHWWWKVISHLFFKLQRNFIMCFKVYGVDV